MLVLVGPTVEAKEVVVNGVWLGVCQELLLAQPNAIAPLIVPAMLCCNLVADHKHLESCNE